MSFLIDINRSNEGTPILTVARETTFEFGSSICIAKVISGERAVDLWEELTGQKYDIEDQ